MRDFADNKFSFLALKLRNCNMFVLTLQAFRFGSSVWRTFFLKLEEIVKIWTICKSIIEIYSEFCICEAKYWHKLCEKCQI